MILVKVDWLSFTVPLRSPAPEPAGNEFMTMAQNAFHAFTGELLRDVLPFVWGDVNKGRGFYHSCVIDDDTKARVSWGNVNPHLYVELSGVACDKLREENTLEDLMKYVVTRVSRIDLAGDIETDVTPLEFVGDSINVRHSTSVIHSDTGETVYLGARSSDRCVRVYRYREPHPRSHLLRIEHEFKHELAKDVCAHVLLKGLPQAFGDAGTSYHFKHACYEPGTAVYAKIPGFRATRRNAGRLLWLNETVAPALIRSHNAGEIDVWQWFSDQIKSKVK